MAEIPDEAKHLFEGTNFANVGTTMPDGSPHTTPVWVALEGDTVIFNTAAGRLKAKNLERDNRVAVSVFNHENPYEAVQIRGTAEISEDDDWEVINALTKRYIGQDEYPFAEEGEVRVNVRVTPERVAYTPPAG
jgi:PPOX class probable F420-dependent enzyme